MTTTESRPPEIYDTQEYAERYAELMDVPLQMLAGENSAPAETSPVLNVELLTRVRDYIQAHPEQHDQRIWVHKTECNTTACIAGWAVLLHGDKVEINPDSLECLFLEDSVTTIDERAKEILGLTDCQAGLLFAYSPSYITVGYINQFLAEVGARSA